MEHVECAWHFECNLCVQITKLYLLIILEKQVKSHPGAGQVQVSYLGQCMRGKSSTSTWLTIRVFEYIVTWTQLWVSDLPKAQASRPIQYQASEWENCPNFNQIYILHHLLNKKILKKLLHYYFQSNSIAPSEVGGSTECFMCFISLWSCK